MQRWRGVESAPSGWGRCVVTVGVFDGVHRGHQLIIGRAVERARELGVPSVLLTFDPHPSEVVRPGSHPPVLTSQRYRAELVEALGVDVVCVQPFTREFSRLTPDEFVHAVLVEHLHARGVVVGANFRYGHKAAGDVAALTDAGRRFGFSVEGVPLQGADDTTWSSTYVRSCVDAGDMAAAAAALGRDHRVEGVVVRGDQRGREIGYPTANLEPQPWAAVPADGIYAGRLVRRTGGAARGDQHRHQPHVLRGRAARRGVRPGLLRRPVRRARRPRLHRPAAPDPALRRGRAAGRADGARRRAHP